MLHQPYNSTTKPTITFIVLLLVSITLSACSKKEAEQDTKKKPQAALISTTTTEASTLEVREESIGTLEGLMDPTVAAEEQDALLKSPRTQGN